MQRTQARRCTATEGSQRSGGPATHATHTGAPEHMAQAVYDQPKLFMRDYRMRTVIGQFCKHLIRIRFYFSMQINKW